MFIPGRIEFLGKHTDYCGGRSMVCATQRGFRISFEPMAESVVVLRNEDNGQSGRVALAPDAVASGPKWMIYPQTVSRRVSANFTTAPLKGVRISFSSDIPSASGLSSSSALVVAVFSAISAVNALQDFPEYSQNIHSVLDLAGYLGCVENGQTFGNLEGRAGVGTFGGSQDHTAILASKAGMLSRFAYCPVRHEADIALPDGLTFVIASSGVHAPKTGTAMEKYNRVSSMVSEIVNAWPGDEKTLAGIIEAAGIDETEKFILASEWNFSREDLIDRVRQFYAENYAIVGQVSELLHAGRADKIGGLIDISQRNAERYLRNQTSETMFLQRSAREIGALAASAFGAGFGGSVYALVESATAENFAAEWRRTYLDKFPHHKRQSEFFATQAAELVSKV